MNQKDLDYKDRNTHTVLNPSCTPNITPSVIHLGNRGCLPK